METRAAGRLFTVYRHLRLGVGSKHGSIRNVCTGATSGGQMTTDDVLATRKNISVLDSTMSYLDTGGSKPVVLFLHGNPTSAYLWRNIIPQVAPVARCIAPDLIGMGHSGKNPAGTYRFVDHYRYLSSWIEKMGLADKKVSVVCHDWGSGLGFHWCNEHRNQVQALVHMESLVGTMPGWAFFPDVARKFFQAMRSPAGEEMVIQKNMFVTRLLPGSIMRTLTEAEMAEYLKPFKDDPESRRPTLTWPREIAVRGDGPDDVIAWVDSYSSWLSKSTDLPKLFINAEPGFFSPAIMKLVSDWPNQKVVTVSGLHFLQEDSPVDIGKAVREFLTEVYKK